MNTTRRHYVNQLKSVIREPYAWPGGYPRYLVMSDGEAICPKCARECYRLILRATRNAHDGSGWRTMGADVNYEDDLTCSHCGDAIPAAYVAYKCGDGTRFDTLKEATEHASRVHRETGVIMSVERD